jgi:hypothetical protein
MKELIEYRAKLVDKLEALAQEFRAACEAAKDPFAKVNGGWTLHQIAVLTRDVQKLVYDARVRQTLHENNPILKNFNQEEWMAAQYNQGEALSAVLDELTKNVEDLCKTLRELPQEAWSRESRHETLGNGFTLQLWVERGVAHVGEHLQVVKNA